MPTPSPNLTKAFIPAIDGRNKHNIKEKCSFILQVWREGKEGRDLNFKEEGEVGKKKKEGEGEEEEEIKISRLESQAVFFFFFNNVSCFVLFLKIFLINLFIFGCVGSSFLCEGFL